METKDTRPAIKDTRLAEDRRLAEYDVAEREIGGLVGVLLSEGCEEVGVFADEGSAVGEEAIVEPSMLVNGGEGVRALSLPAGESAEPILKASFRRTWGGRPQLSSKSLSHSGVLTSKLVSLVLLGDR